MQTVPHERDHREQGRDNRHRQPYQTLAAPVRLLGDFEQLLSVHDA